MIRVENFQQKYINISLILLVILFSYAAIFKGFDMLLFQKQMAESPLIPMELIQFLSYLIPIGEILICFLLIFDETRLIGFLMSYFTMLLFSVYLLALTHYFGHNLPCACGGILNKMGYTEHIIFNIFFTILSLIALLVKFKLKKSNNT